MFDAYVAMCACVAKHARLERVWTSKIFFTSETVLAEAEP